MQPERDSKIAQLCDMIQSTNDNQNNLDKLVALSMKTGYELGKQTSSK